MKDIFRLFSGLAVFFASWPMAYKLLLILFLLDIISGVISSIYQGKRITSRDWIKGICKKLGVAIGVSTAHLLDTCIPSITIPIGEISACFFAAGESISIIENIGKCGVESPSKLKKVIEDLKSNN